LTVFFASGSIMVVELVAGRLISRYVGMSLYTWTAVIGIMLAGMAIGNYIGGGIADRFRPRRALCVLFFLAAAACLSMLPLNDLAGRWALLSTLSWPIRIFCHVSITYLAPAVCLGTINPVVAKMALDLGRASGRTIGAVYAWGAGGSLIGTFLTGYYLVLMLDTGWIVVAMAAALALLGTVYLVTMGRGGNQAEETDGDRAGTQGSGKARIFEIALLTSYATVFMSNAAFMMTEMAAMRIVAREFGASLYTWTTVIGVVLAGVTLGNYLGGRLADRFASRGLLAAAFLVGAVGCVLSPTAGAVIGEALDTFYYFRILSWPAQICLFSAGAFFVPCAAMGMISPIVVKLALNEGRAVGHTVGSIYAWGTVGGIAATFLAGYHLIAWLGSLPVLALVAAAMALTAWCHAPRKHIVQAGAVVLVGVLVSTFLPFTIAVHLAQALSLRSPQDATLVYEDESNYSYIAVHSEPENAQIRDMRLDKLVHSQVHLDDPLKLVYEYEWVYTAVLDHYVPLGDPIQAMVIGGGGFTYPHYLVLARPNSYVDVSEIDPSVTEAAFQAFGLPRNAPMEIFNMDARNRIADLMRMSDQERPLFDCILGDSINDFTVPYHLTTVEFVRDINTLLTDDGVYMLNMIDIFDSGKFLAAVIRTCREVFPHVYVFNTGRPSMIRDTFILVNAHRALDLSELPAAIARAHDEAVVELLSEAELDALVARTGNLILTDSHAPVENLLQDVARSRRGDDGELRLEHARDLTRKGELKKAIKACRAALEIHPYYPEAHELLARLLFDASDLEAALEICQHMRDTYVAQADVQYRIAQFLLEKERSGEAVLHLRTVLAAEPGHGPAHYLLGLELFRARHIEEAIGHWETATLLQPDNVLIPYNLGLAYAGSGNNPKAIRAWQHALAIDPSHEDSYHNLALAFVLEEDREKALKVIGDMGERGIEPDPALLLMLDETP
jgi:spermidine synthase/thioredoxin-like negative regulator of GroEL